MQNSEKRVALLTGANKGIGSEIARQPAVKEITVLIVARDQDRGLKDQ
jgi:short-subunit dehydrogenase